MLGQLHAGIVGRGVGRDDRTAAAGVGQVGHPDGGRPVGKRVAPEDTAPGVGVAKKEAALDLALGIIAKGV